MCFTSVIASAKVESFCLNAQRVFVFFTFSRWWRAYQCFIFSQVLFWLALMLKSML